MTFTFGTLSWIFAAGWLATMTRFAGRTLSDDGIMPKEQLMSAPFTTICAILIVSLNAYRI
jgi:hypothetical protein